MINKRVETINKRFKTLSNKTAMETFIKFVAVTLLKMYVDWHVKCQVYTTSRVCMTVSNSRNPPRVLIPNSVAKTEPLNCVPLYQKDNGPTIPSAPRDPVNVRVPQGPGPKRAAEESHRVCQMTVNQKPGVCAEKLASLQTADPD